MIGPGAVTNLASGQEYLAPGALARVVMESRLTDTEWAEDPPWPQGMGGAMVRLGGMPAATRMVSPSEIQFQVPWGIIGGPQELNIEDHGAVRWNIPGASCGLDLD